MFETPETVETHRLTGATTLNLGFMSKEAAAKVETALHGKTFMSFEVICTPSPGGTWVAFSTEYKESPVEIFAFAMNVMASA